MMDFKSYLESEDIELLDEAGNISSGLAIKKFNDVIKYGKAAVKSKSVEEKLDNLARQNASVGSLVIMSVAVSGDKSLGSSLTRILSLRGL